MGFHEEELLIGKVLDVMDDAMSRKHGSYWRSLRLRGLMLERLGENEKALEVYRRCRDAVQCTDFYKNDILARIDRLKGETRKEKGK